jgi:hypothetical protein
LLYLSRPTLVLKRDLREIPFRHEKAVRLIAADHPSLGAIRNRGRAKADKLR